LDVHPAGAAGEKVAAAAGEGEMRLDDDVLAAPLPPIKVAVKIAVGIIEHQALAARMLNMLRERRREVSQGVAAQRVGAKIKCNRQHRRAARTEPARRANLKLDLRIVEERLSEKLLDRLEQENGRTGITDRRQHQAKGGAGILVVIDIKDLVPAA